MVVRVLNDRALESRLAHPSAQPSSDAELVTCVRAAETTEQLKCERTTPGRPPIVTAWQLDAPAHDQDARHADRFAPAAMPPKWAGRFTVAIAWRAVTNRVWRIPGYNGKYPQRPERNGGGFGVQAFFQANALDLRSDLFTATGDDASGDALRRELAETGANLAGIKVLPGLTTAAEVIVCNGYRAVLIDQSAPSVQWQPDHRDLELLARADAVWCGGTLPDVVVEALCQKARQHGKPVFANPTRLQNPGSIDLRGVAICQISRDDVTNFGFASDAPAAAVAELFLARGCGVVVVTESERGERAFDQGGGSVWMPGVPGRNPLYPTGAGDVALAAHAAGYLCGLSFYDWVNLGTLAGAFFVERGSPATWADLAELGREWPPERRITNVS